MRRNIAIFTLLISTLFSAWLYWGSDYKERQLLKTYEWQSKLTTYIEQKQLADFGPLRKVDVTSNVKYLPNNSYIRLSVIRLYAVNDQPETTVSISETGTWELSDDYLLLSPTEFKDMSSNTSKEFTPEQLGVITQFFKMDAQQSRRVDIVDNKTILLTGLNHDSILLYAR